ncbi:MAG: carbon-nitrogen hydrolase family protein [marine benthic group bacterium]|nr:carbon-nitrogen hydrolase family protein [Gemmatimonadota bacterium]
MCESLAAAAAEGARLVVFPEAALTGYLFDDPDEAREGAVDLVSPEIARIEQACRDLGTWCVYGAIERVEGGRIYNAAFLQSPGARRERYRKVHTLCLGVDRYTCPGEEGFRVWDTPIGRIGLHICYDGSFPESARVLKLLGAQIAILPTNWPDIELKTELVRVRARENHLWYLAVNRVGTERGVAFPGGSVAADPAGRVLAELGARPSSFIVDIDPVVADANRVVREAGIYEYDYIADRRPDAYGPLARLKPGSRGSV